jgi:hypothetical protein
MTTSTQALKKLPAKTARKTPLKKTLATASKTKIVAVKAPALKKPVSLPAKPKQEIKASASKVEAKKVAGKPITKPIEKPIKAKKMKLVRDSFTIPKPEYLVLDNLKLRAADLKHPVKKGELLRAGIKALAAMTDINLLAALKAVPMLKTGRPSH